MLEFNLFLVYDYTLFNLGDTGFVRCKRDMVAPMLSPPEIERQASGDHCIEEDTLVTGKRSTKLATISIQSPPLAVFFRHMVITSRHIVF